jgi:hypothetical protein
MQQDRKSSLAVGVLFLATFVTAIAGKFLYAPVLDDADFILGVGSESRVAWGAVFELLLIIANIGTAVVLFPILKRQSETGALGYVAARIMECAFIAVGIISLLAVLTLRQDAPNSEALGVVGESLVAIHDWTFILGPNFVVGVGNGLILGFLMFRSGLVPRKMAMLGLIGGPLVCASGIFMVLGVFDEGSAAQMIVTIPEFFWELSLGLYLTFKGFRRRPGPSTRGIVASPA